MLPGVCSGNLRIDFHNYVGFRFGMTHTCRSHTHFLAGILMILSNYTLKCMIHSFNFLGKRDIFEMPVLRDRFCDTRQQLQVVQNLFSAGECFFLIPSLLFWILSPAGPNDEREKKKRRKRTGTQSNSPAFPFPLLLFRLLDSLSSSMLMIPVIM